MSPLDLFFYIVYAIAALAIGGVVAGAVYMSTRIMMHALQRWADKAQ